MIAFQDQNNAHSTKTDVVPLLHAVLFPPIIPARLIT